ncbi:GspE/PulE family protein [Patescibacteria group bacterium]|nr:GspE/PulE family protein [Patescibacteria group bacterium]MBU1672992.1 GspE/PulE family protein [Patescibacteria group bacterium]MBU1962973.1 GspE/PulE family protein [Patescibacteria group bacterium]
MRVSIDELKKFLVDSGFISDRKFAEAEKDAKAHKKAITDVLLEKNYLSDEQLGQVMSSISDYPYIHLAKESIPLTTLKVVPENIARKQYIIAFKKTPKGIHVAMADPDNLELFQALKKKTGEEIIPYVATKRDIQNALSNYKREIKEEFDSIIEESVKQAEAMGIKSVDLPIIKIVDTIIEYAYENKASDIHIEPQEKQVLVRFRIDGVLHDVITLPKEVHELVVMRIKILARLRTDEHRAAMDGKFFKVFHDERVDVRVSIVPVSDGEKVVMRLLASQSQQFTLEELGLHDEDLKIVKAAYLKPHGMILVTGPTGSGKTTTLYAVLKLLNRRDVNIATIEDPVEYGIEGINQIQVNAKTNLTFAAGLKSIIRQDPDVIMVGEIRDNETAGIAVNAAMTGHLVLSTLHTNDAPTTLPRLLDMDVEPFLIASTINVIIAQRLVRKICPKCVTSEVVTGKDLEHIKREAEERGTTLEKILGKKSAKELRIYHGRGCKTCGNSGYKGRVGIFEVMEIEDNIKKLIMSRTDSGVIRDRAVENGMLTMFEDGLTKVVSGKTTIDEIIRVTSE